MGQDWRKAPAHKRTSIFRQRINLRNLQRINPNSKTASTQRSYLNSLRSPGYSKKGKHNRPTIRPMGSPSQQHNPSPRLEISLFNLIAFNYLNIPNYHFPQIDWTLANKFFEDFNTRLKYQDYIHLLPIPVFFVDNLSDPNPNENAHKTTKRPGQREGEEDSGASSP